MNETARSPEWFRYEVAARKVLSDLRAELGVATVEGKQTLRGESSADWELDAVAWLEGGEGFLVVEARRHTKAGQKQEALAALAWRIQDVGAAGGVIVSPLPLQSGAERVAAHAGIEHVLLSADSTSERYLAEYMGRRFLGVSIVESMHLSDTVSVVLGWAPGADPDAPA